MERISKFEKVSEAQFVKDGGKDYESVVLPQRATSGSAGYDFYSSAEIVLAPKSHLIIPTGIRVRISDGWVLCIFPRSGLGFKYGISLKNTVGIIDSDYYKSNNEGHIMINLQNPSEEEVVIHKNKAFAQGVFLPFGITEDDDVSKERDGGFGSTDKR